MLHVQAGPGTFEDEITHEKGVNLSSARSRVLISINV